MFFKHIQQPWVVPVYTHHKVRYLIYNKFFCIIFFEWAICLVESTDVYHRMQDFMPRGIASFLWHQCVLHIDDTLSSPVLTIALHHIIHDEVGSDVFYLDCPVSYLDLLWPAISWDNHVIRYVCFLSTHVFL